MRITLKGKDLKRAIKLWLEDEFTDDKIPSIVGITTEYNPVEVELTIDLDDQ